ncbi:pro-cathepsin H-like [Zerene cesonia]|uniref:pro-cathepsin H-like n=1 Tax=Zerene cesonia TaxID=33412 RepID=UPI0018E4DD8C|nr:pro-cathepsin H-like [Zerene cesonia]
MYSILLLFLLVSSSVLANPSLLDQDYFEVDDASTIFEQFIKRYEKNYAPDEYDYRLSVFKDTLEKLNQWNIEDPGAYGLQEFSDLTFEEISDKYLGLKGNISDVETVEFKSDQLYTSPENVDWREYGVVSPVKDQRQCGSCYAFSAIGHIESRYAMKYHKIKILSEQQALDCDTMDYGCQGGLPHNVFSSLMSGVMLSRDYPYVQRQGFCRAKGWKAVVKVKKFTVFKNLDEDDLKEAVASYGPLSISMFFTHRMSHIKDGRVYKPVDCVQSKSNHAVLLVGYGQENDDDYWIIKNSWGTGWGDKGYMRLLRGFGVCNIGTYAALAEVTRVGEERISSGAWVVQTGGVGNIEGQYAKVHNTEAISLSEQQIIDCDRTSHGCYGGWPHDVFNSLAAEGGSMREDDYPYAGVQGQCSLDRSRIAVRVTGGQQISISDEESLKDALVQYGPLSVVIEVNQEFMLLQGQSIFKPTTSCDEGLHAVLLIGYGNDGTDDYWILKNSWGTTWGDQGFYRMVMGQHACNIGDYAASATVE